MRDDRSAWKRRAATIARRSAARLQERFAREPDPERKRRLSWRITRLQEIAQEAFDVTAEE